MDPCGTPCIILDFSEKAPFAFIFLVLLLSIVAKVRNYHGNATRKELIVSKSFNYNIVRHRVKRFT
jgi:hypothetical protein